MLLLLRHVGVNMASVCYDCKVGYGHRLSYCPKCGRMMKQVKHTPDWKKLRENNWILEGSAKFEDFFEGKQIVVDSTYEFLAEKVKTLYPAQWASVGLTSTRLDDIILRKEIKWVHNEYERSITLILIGDGYKIEFPSLKVFYRLVGSDLPVGPNPNEQENFDESKI
jgi:hypothetical protein